MMKHRCPMPMLKIMMTMVVTTATHQHIEASMVQQERLILLLAICPS